MATNTTNYGWTKPDYEDAADIMVINDTIDNIDAQVKTNENNILLLRTVMAYVGYAEIEKVEKVDDEGRMTIWYHAYYSGNDTVSYGCLISREVPIGTALTVENAEVDYNLSVAYTTFRSRDLLNGLGVSLKPYIEISKERHYGVQQRYFYNDL